MEDRLTGLRDKLFRACEGHDADESIVAAALAAGETSVLGAIAVAQRSYLSAPPVAS